MPDVEKDPLGPHFEQQLREALDRVMPPGSYPRYRFASRPHSPLIRFASAGVAVAALGLVTLSAYAATGSANPSVWTQRAITVIQSSSQTGAPSPTPESGDEPSPGGSRQVQEPAATPRPSERPDHPESPEPQESPHQTGGDGGSSGSGGSEGGPGPGSGSGDASPSPDGH